MLCGPGLAWPLAAVDPLPLGEVQQAQPQRWIAVSLEEHAALPSVEQVLEPVLAVFQQVDKKKTAVLFTLL